jgi:SAM-dependent methyltransferase
VPSYAGSVDRTLLLSPAAFRAEFDRAPRRERDAWLDGLLGLEEVPEDGPDLPRGCVPYLPCSVEALHDTVLLAEVGASDVFVDVGAGIGRAALFVHLLTGARTVGLEIQSSLVDRARALLARLDVTGVDFIECDAVETANVVPTGTVFFLYCPFGAARADRLLDLLEPLARTRPIRFACVDMPPVTRPWLRLRASGPKTGVMVYDNVTRL